MEFIRINDTRRLPLNGELTATPYCRGPRTSLDDGYDSPCCARCHVLRCCYYRQTGVLVTNPDCLEFIKLFPKALDACIIPTCGATRTVSDGKHPGPTVFFYTGTTEHEPECYVNVLKEQFIIRKNMKVFDMVITASAIAFTDQRVPIVLPTDKTRRITEPESDDGIRLNENRTALTVTDLDKARRAGRWMYVINYYQTLIALNPGVQQLPGRFRSGDTTWLALL